MNRVKVEGKHKEHQVLMYAISTCNWCRMTKKFMKELSVEYEYIDVDLCSKEDKEAVKQDIQRRGGDLRYPTIIIDDKTTITGLRKEKIKEVLGL